MVAGALSGAGGMYWLSRTSATDSYLGHVFGAFIIAAFGLSLVSVPFVALALWRVRQTDSGAASSVVNVARWSAARWDSLPSVPWPGPPPPTRST